ncbi:nuclear transport factor 2 family protein [Sphingobium sufflavum]|uniref:nuclear transport factor 2 family protein n=1 Tax=Sphingobium sufflavum TaxID=1129547 RepID=UPI001F1EF01F|nr:nuclear transport factor 2 family protein [Sphingobium sufflavum]MCE7798446.1 nuclear transport factor 2 family protein [Sphingobium sufflavum]
MAEAGQDHREESIMTDHATIVAAIHRYCRVQCEKDREGWASLFAEDVVQEDPVGLSRTQGRAQVTGPFWDNIVRNDVQIWLTDEIIVCGREAVAIMACDIGPADRRRRLAPVVDQFVFDAEGRIAVVRGFYNLG